MIHSLIQRVLAALLAMACMASASPVAAQNAAPAAPAPTAAAPAASESMGGVKSANIFSIAPDANTDPKYTDQTNAERGKVQPGNNAPLWRQVGAGVTGYSSLPLSQAPEAGNLIQAFVQYPGSP